VSSKVPAGQVGEKKLRTAIFLLNIIFLIIFWWFRDTSNMSKFFILFLLVSYPLPEVVARLINIYQEKNGKSIFDLYITQWGILKNIIGFVLGICLIVIILTPNSFSIHTYPDGKSITTYESKYTFENLLYVAFIISFMVLSLMHLTQKIKVYDEGLLYDGRMWKWSDFQSYLHKKYSNEFLLKTVNNDKIKLKTSPESREKFNSMLAQKLRKEIES
jgi:hypothetical protein